MSEHWINALARQAASEAEAAYADRGMAYALRVASKAAHRLAAEHHGGNADEATVSQTASNILHSGAALHSLGEA